MKYLKTFETYDIEKYKIERDRKEKEGKEKHDKFQKNVQKTVKKHDKFVTDFNQLGKDNKRSYALFFEGKWSAPWFITRMHIVYPDDNTTDYDILFWFDDIMFNGDPYPRGAQFNKADILKFIEDKKVKYYDY